MGAPINIEQNKIGEAVGSQDQVATAYGGFNYTEFSKENEFSVYPFKFIKENSNLLDIGSYPGGWSQVASNIILNGKILAVDIKNMDPIKNVKYIKGDILNEDTKKKVIKSLNSKLDVIISDMAANTTGNKALDSIRTNQLCADTINFSKNTLKPKGVLISKLFMGEDFIEVKNLAKSLFKKINFFKPESSRSESKETYLHCETLKTL